MKKLLIIILYIGYAINAFCQDSFSLYKAAYEKVDISKISGTVLFMLNEQMKSIDNEQYNAFIGAKRESIYKKFNLGTKLKQQQFLDNYNINLSKVKDIVFDKDVLMHVSPKVIANYGSSVLSRYQGNYSSEFINALLQPVIKSKLVEYTNYTIDSVSKIILSEQHRLDLMSEQIVAYWKATEEKIITFQKDKNAIQKKILKIVNDISKENNDESLQNFLLQSSQSLAENIKLKFDAGWNGTLPVVNLDKNKYQKQFAQLYQTYASAVKEKTEEGFKILGGAIDSLSKNEVKVYQTLAKIQGDWNIAKQKIDELETNMRAAQNNPALLADYAVKHAKLVAENFLRLDVISKYVNKGVDVYNTVALIKSEVFDKATDPAFISSLSLDNLSLPTLSDACASAAGFASQVAHTFPNCKPLQIVATAANYLMAAVNIAVGVAELYSMNPMGLVNIFSGLSSVFGGKPEPSPEMKMMQQMMDYMQEQFKNINDHLVFIEDQLKSLTETVQSMYRDMMKSFKVVNDKLDILLWENNTLYNATRILVFKDMAACQNVEENRLINQETSPGEFKTYEALYNFYQGNPDVARCLPILRDFSTPLLQGLFSFSLTQPGQQISLDAEDLEKSNYVVTKIYNPMIALFSNFYANDCYGINSLGVPGAKISNNGENYTEVRKINKCLGNTFQGVFSDYYNYAAIKEVSDLLITYSNYYLFQDVTKPGYNPLKFLEFLNLPPAAMSSRYNNIKSNLVSLLNLANKSILQQSLMAGNNVLNVAYNYLLGTYDTSRPNSSNIIENTIVALENNNLFAKNFASMLIYGSIGDVTKNKLRAKRFSDLYFSVDISRKDTLNTEFKVANVTFDLDNSNSLILKVQGRGRAFSIPVPSPTFVINDEMAQSDGLYTLLATKQKIMDKLIDLTYFQNFTPVSGLLKDDYKYLIQDLKK